MISRNQKISFFVFLALGYVLIFLISMSRVALAAGEGSNCAKIDFSATPVVTATCVQRSAEGLSCPTGYTRPSYYDVTAYADCDSGLKCCFNDSEVSSANKTGGDKCGQVKNTDGGYTIARCFKNFGYIGGCPDNRGSLASYGGEETASCGTGDICCMTTDSVGVDATTPDTTNIKIGGSDVGTGGSNVGTGGTTSSGTRTGSTGGLVPCTDDCTLCHLVVGFKNIFDYLLYTVLAPLFILGIVVSGVLYMVSSGSKGLTEKAKMALTYSITGFVIALTAWLIVNFVMLTLGFTSPLGGSWYKFTCDTSQSKTAASSTTTGTTTTGTKASGDLDATTQKVINNYKTMVGMGYGEKFSGDTYGGKSTADCGSTSIRSWLMAGLPDFWGLPRERWDGDSNSLKPGDICLFDKSATGIDHAFLVMENGSTSGANDAKGIYVSSNGLNYNISRLNGNSSALYVVHIANYIK